MSGFSKKDQLKKNKVKKKSTFGTKKSFIKKRPRKVKDKGLNLFDRTITVRFSDTENNKRIKWIHERFDFCQVCGKKHNLDIPHHAIFGFSRKDDRTRISICCDCHRIIHTKGYGDLLKSKEEIQIIGWMNNFDYLTSIGYVFEE